MLALCGGNKLARNKRHKASQKLSIALASFLFLPVNAAFSGKAYDDGYLYHQQIPNVSSDIQASPLIQAAAAGISVQGTGTVEVERSAGFVQLSVIKNGETAAKAFAATTQATTDFITSLKQAGIDEKHIKADMLSLAIASKNAKSYSMMGSSSDGTYSVQSTIIVTIHDFNQYITIIDKAKEHEVRGGEHLQKVEQEPAAFLQQARQKAAEDAVARARLLAEKTGATLGNVIAISEKKATVQTGMPVYGYDRMSDLDNKDRYSVEIVVTFELKDKAPAPAQ